MSCDNEAWLGVGGCWRPRSSALLKHISKGQQVSDVARPLRRDNDRRGLEALGTAWIVLFASNRTNQDFGTRAKVGLAISLVGEASERGRLGLELQGLELKVWLSY